MNKNVIKIIAIVVMLGLAGYFVYRMFSGGSSGLGDSGVSTAAVNEVSPILPRGNTLDFDKIKKFNPTLRTNNYPQATDDQIGFTDLNPMISTQ